MDKSVGSDGEERECGIRSIVVLGPGKQKIGQEGMVFKLTGQVLRNRLARAFGIPLLLLAFTTAVAFATDSSPQCDSTPKYYCTYVNYDSNVNGGWNINHRYYEGSTANNGTTDKWQLWYAGDWYSNTPGVWTLQTDWGSGPWYTNGTMSSYYEQGSAASIIYNAAVTMRTRYHDPTQPTGYWCSQITEADLFNGSSMQESTSDCSSN